MDNKNKDTPLDPKTKDRRETQKASLDLDRAFNDDEKDVEGAVDNKGAPRIPPD